jgi:hypothetical protein
VITTVAHVAGFDVVAGLLGQDVLGIHTVTVLAREN